MDNEINDFYSEMMETTSVIVVELEKRDWSPCDALKIANEATQKAWNVWNKQAEEIHRLTEENKKLQQELDDINFAIEKVLVEGF